MSLAGLRPRRLSPALSSIHWADAPLDLINNRGIGPARACCLLLPVTGRVDTIFLAVKNDEPLSVNRRGKRWECCPRSSRIPGADKIRGKACEVMPVGS